MDRWREGKARSNELLEWRRTPSGVGPLSTVIIRSCKLNLFIFLQCLGQPTTLHRNSAQATANRNNNACRSPNRCS